MSLTSYRAAPSRVRVDYIVERYVFVFARFGDALLSHTLRCSTIGATVLNFRVRDGTGCFTCAVATKPRKILILWRLPEIQSIPSLYTRCMLLISSFAYRPEGYLRQVVTLSVTGTNQAYRTISTGQLNALLRLHLRPIDEVVYLGPQGYLVLRGASRLDAFSGYPVRS